MNVSNRIDTSKLETKEPYSHILTSVQCLSLEYDELAAREWQITLTLHELLD